MAFGTSGTSPYYLESRMYDFSENAGEPTTWEHRHDDAYAAIKSRFDLWAIKGLSQSFMYSQLFIYYELVSVSTRQKLLRSTEQDTNVRYYSIPLAEAFQMARQQYPSISVDPDVMAGAPCIAGTRIPVYMVLDAIEHHGTIEGAVASFPKLDIAQVKDAIGFAKLVVECPIGDETASAS